MNNLSIIIPTKNEKDNISPLIKRLHACLSASSITYEIIFVDDHSTDGTQAIISSMAHFYPIYGFKKQGKIGKANSLIEGFSYAKYDLLCMIDADLQYPPEAIPAMVEKISMGADIVVANRKEQQVNFIRKLFSEIYRSFFVKALHGIDLDSQSGLKVIKKEIVERVPMQKGKWAIDLTLLTQAKNAGYQIDTVDIVYAQRASGKTKVNLVTTSLELIMNALHLRLQPAVVIPFHPSVEKVKGKGFHFKNQEFVHHSHLAPEHTAFKRVSTLQIIVGTFLLVDIILGLIINWHATIEIFVSALTILYFGDLLFNLYLISRNFFRKTEVTSTDTQISQLNDADLPVYTVFCPLYKEWNVVPQFISAMSKLDYPQDKLQVMLLLEEDDRETIDNINLMELPSSFDVVVVPNSKPKTKPKALNYGLLHARGEYCVIYDAEDVPDPLQLKKAILAFQKSGDRTLCVQAKLNFYNPHQNILTRLFTSEYSLWFDLVLTGLQSIEAPIPLGGTSNHFRTRDIRDIKGWDSFNVTEDCDLGIRLVKQGYTTAIIDSVTLEEANSSFSNWFGQRTRWIKGYIQTYLVHMRDLTEFRTSKHKSHVITFQLIVGGKIMSMFINPMMWLLTLCYFLFRAHIGTFIESFFPTPILYIGVVSILLGNFLYIYYYMIGCAKHEHDALLKYAVFVPFYWLAMSVCAWMAVYNLIVAPHHWSKTKHGLHLQKPILTANPAIETGPAISNERIISNPNIAYTN
ncbi:MAG TPA: glycosyltransferase [Candidatus Saccharimonadales bacterium]|nr:glycosyltransferase [Candidatus Saccharimonadales bacterium]